MGLHDWTGIHPLRLGTHVKLTHRRHAYYGKTGQICRIDLDRRKVWVALPGGTVVPAGHRSVEVIVPRSAT